MSSRPTARAVDAEQVERRAAALRTVPHSDFDDAETARRRLREHGLSDAEIDRQLATLAANTAATPAVLTSYSLLHSLQHLDRLRERAVPMSEPAAATIALLRAVEIALGCSATLARRMRANLEAGRVDRAIANATWRAGLHQLTMRLSALLVEVGAEAEDGVEIPIRSSRAWLAYRSATDDLHDHLRSAWPEAEDAIFALGLDDPRRFVFFHEFVNVGEERCWLARLAAVRVPGVAAAPDEDDLSLRERLVGDSEIERMLEALETREETDLLPFRVVHQISELLAEHVNDRLCTVAVGLVHAPEAELDRVARSLEVGNRLVRVTEDCLRLMQRALTPAAYQAVRRNLGMVRGTSSVVLRRILFNSTYPLVARALALRLAAFDAALADDDDEIAARAAVALRGDTPAERAVASLIRELIGLHQVVRTWRDFHQQLPKTHLGVSPQPDRPTVSLSGSESAVDVAHELRRVHEKDPISPFHRAAFGAPPPAVHDLLTAGGFDEWMAHRTARAVFSTYAEVQERFETRRQRRSAPSAAAAD